MPPNIAAAPRTANVPGLMNNSGSQLFSISPTNLPRAHPMSNDGTNRPLGTAAPEVRHANRKYTTKKRSKVRNS